MSLKGKERVGLRKLMKESVNERELIQKCLFGSFDFKQKINPYSSGLLCSLCCLLLDLPILVKESIAKVILVHFPKYWGAFVKTPEKWKADQE